MDQYVYDPPAGSKPLEFHHNGGPIVFFPPDQFWKRNVFEKTIGVKLDHEGKVMREVKRTLTGWEIDHEKNTAASTSGLQPDNTRWLTKGQYRSVMAGKYAPLNRYLRRVQDVDKAFRKSAAQLESEHKQKIEQMRQHFAIEEQAIRDGAMKEIQEMTSHFKTVLAKTAKEVGVSVEELERALMKHREQTPSGRVTKNREARREGRVLVEGENPSQS